MNPPPRARAQAMATRRGGRHTLAVPLAVRLAARIQERPLDRYFTDPTQLANGLRDLLEAVRPDGIAVTLPDVLADEVADGLTGPRTACALEATNRLRQTVGDGAVLLAALPAAPDDVLVDAARRFVDTGADVLLLHEPPGAAAARTILNVSRFHRVLACCGKDAHGLPAPEVADLHHPAPHTGLVLTAGEVPPETPITDVEAWVAAVRAS